MDKTLIKNRVLELNKIVKTLEEYSKMSLKELVNNFGNILAIEHGLQISIQILLDIGNHILSSIGENNISDYSDIIERLGGEKNTSSEIC